MYSLSLTFEMLKSHKLSGYYDIKNHCRQGMTGFLFEALSEIPEMNNPHIIDVGCGFGAVTLALAKRYAGSIKALDIDKSALSYLSNSVDQLGYTNKVNISNQSLFDIQAENETYDIAIAEGLLNTVGFEKGLKHIVGLMKRNGVIVIHDDQKNKDEKLELFKSYDCQKIKTINLSEGIWWEHYYKPLDDKIKSIKNTLLLNNFESDLKEIERFKQGSFDFCSTYYVLQYSN
ncbi:SAM-dependent methyltransferase [Carboxylicivirga sp. RSCT41]|uniref:SAM-dependent methyltransferase n=1 Tax=Carboxylicivirga agarovorans TaxID=3417570 RepID=UPI003D330A1B